MLFRSSCYLVIFCHYVRAATFVSYATTSSGTACFLLVPEDDDPEDPSVLGIHLWDWKDYGRVDCNTERICDRPGREDPTALYVHLLSG